MNKLKEYLERKMLFLVFFIPGILLILTGLVCNEMPFIMFAMILFCHAIIFYGFDL